MGFTSLLGLVSSVLVVVIHGAVIPEDDPCPRSNIHNFYRELNCEPIYENASRCPSSFNCQKFEARNKGQCTYKGRSYAVGDAIPANESDPCFSHCACVKDAEGASFACAVVDCPELWLSPLPENCFPLFNRDQCCSTGTFCANETTTPTKLTCEVDGKTYYEGERFYPEGDSCKKCYCLPGFRGKLEEPFCENIACNVELSRGNRLNEDCVPVYYGKQGCCPISWKCPPETVSTRISAGGGDDKMTTSARCKFGNLELRQFDVLEEDGVRCECVVPPYLTCIDVSELSPLDRSLHELGMLSAITDSRHQYLDEMMRKRSATMDSRPGKRCAFHILQINSNFVGSISPCKLCTKRSNHRVKPYLTPANRLFRTESSGGGFVAVARGGAGPGSVSGLPPAFPAACERTRTKSENSDTGNENVDCARECGDAVIASIGLYKSKSLENIHTSSHSSRDFKLELDELKKRTEENTDVELVSSRIRCLNVSNK